MPRMGALRTHIRTNFRPAPVSTVANSSWRRLGHLGRSQCPSLPQCLIWAGSFLLVGTHVSRRFSRRAPRPHRMTNAMRLRGEFANATSLVDG